MPPYFFYFWYWQKKKSVVLCNHKRNTALWKEEQSMGKIKEDIEILLASTIVLAFPIVLGILIQLM